MAMVILSAQMNYLESGKNEVISRITLQREELKEMNRELAKLSTVASKADNAIVITDQNGKAEWVNDGFVRLTGYLLEEVRGQRTIDVLHGRGTSRDSALELQQAIREHQSFSGELLKYRKDGSPFWTQLNMTPIFSEDGLEKKFIFIESDVTNRKIAEEKTKQYMKNLERTNSELDKFAYVVSHDLKAPLRAIGSLTDWVEEDAGPMLNAESLSHLHTIKGRVIRMEGLINGILDYTKAAKKNEEIAKIDSGELVRETIDLLGPPAGVMVSMRGEYPQISVRKVKLQQVFMNLVSNAFKYNDKEDKQVEVGCELQGQNCVFYVKDNGPGIEKAYHEKIFVIFQTLNARDEVESRGVGLAIVKKIVEEEGGRIWVESEPGSGACFRFIWPRTARVTAEESVFLAEQNA
jgi:PAS domain S-box-containing protein